MTDIELVELAAKAAGISVRYVSNGDESGAFFTEPNQLWWNPLEDDGDALRLAVSLSISVIHSTDGQVLVMSHDASISIREWRDVTASPTRRAIVRVAAEIGGRGKEAP